MQNLEHGQPTVSRHGHKIVVIFALISSALVSGCRTQSVPRAALLKPLPHTENVFTNGLLELSFTDTTNSARSFFEGRLTGQFTSPDGRPHTRAGFYRGSGIWMIRFRPEVTGNWLYSVTFERNGTAWNGGGRFRAVLPSAAASIGRDPENVHRWVFAGGEPYFPLGIQDCIDFVAGEDDVFFTIDGEGRNDGTGRRLPSDEFFSLYAQAGFNLFRFSQRNCSPPLFDSLASYRERDMNLTDKLLHTARRHGFRILFGFFGYHGHWYQGNLPGKVWHALRVRAGVAEEGIHNPADTSMMAREKRFIDYAVARWGEYVDFWELLNERRAHHEWTRAMAAHVHSTDPSRKPVSTSWDQPDIAELDFTSPHWYVSEPPSESDLRTVNEAAKWKKYGKPVLIGEHGNTGMNWDPGSADRMRVRLWTALFQEIGVILWHTGWSKYGMFEGRYRPGQAANIYLGPQERSYTRILTAFESRLRAGLRIAPAQVSRPGEVRVYALTGSGQTAAYLVHHANPAAAVSVDVTLPADAGMGKAEWINPRTGQVVATTELRPGQQTVRTPPFGADLALLVSRPVKVN
jgi:hypothetical protein